MNSTDIYTDCMIKYKFNEAYWIASEMLAMSSIFEWLRTNNKSIEQIFDAGCGEGRLFSIFAPYAKYLYAIDKDEARLEQAKFVASSLMFDHIKFENICIESLAEQNNEHNKFDLVICSHVLQHVITEKLDKIISSLANITKKNGRILITTCFTNSDKDEFISCEFGKDGNQIEQQICEYEFNQRISKNLVSAHRFTINTINQLCYKYDLQIMEMRLFHLLESNQPWEISVTDKLMLDSLALHCAPLRSCALDILVILTHTGKSD